MDKRIILGLDPGSIRMGFGLIQERSTATPELITCGVWHLKKYTTYMLRMRYIYTNMMELFNQYSPDEVAIESVFYGKNIQSMLKLGRAQGVAIAAALACEIPVAEYAPCKVKQAVTGKGNASKAQVSAMIRQLLGISLQATDASDALAIALCHSQQRLATASPVKRWSQFISANPDRIVGAKASVDPVKV